MSRQAAFKRFGAHDEKETTGQPPIDLQTADGSTALGKLANRHLSTGAIVQVTLRHETGEWMSRVAYNGSGKITGILIAPPGTRDLPF